MKFEEKPPPKAPPAYRPQPTPKCLQLKPINGRPVNTSAQSIKKSNRKLPVAPPAYRPQQTPLVLQRKVTTPQHNPPRSTPRTTSGQWPHATPVSLQEAPKLQVPSPQSPRAARLPIQRRTAAAHVVQCFGAAVTCGQHALSTHAPFARALAGVVQRAEDSSDDEAEDVREIIDMIEEAEEEMVEFFAPAQESATTATTQRGEVRRTFNMTDSRSLYELVRTVATEEMRSFYVRVHEGSAYNIRKTPWGQWLLHDATGTSVHYTQVVSRLNIGADDKGMAAKVRQRLEGTLDLTTVTAAQLDAIDLLLLLGVCEGIRLGGNVTTFLHTLERIEVGIETFTNAFSAAKCAYVPARKKSGTGQEKHLRGLNTKKKRKKGTAHSSAEILREFSRRPMGGVKKPGIVRGRVGNYTHRPWTYEEYRRLVKAKLADKAWLLERQRMGFDLPAESSSSSSAGHMPYIT